MNQRQKKENRYKQWLRAIPKLDLSELLYDRARENNADNQDDIAAAQVVGKHIVHKSIRPYAKHRAQILHKVTQRVGTEKGSPD